MSAERREKEEGSAAQAVRRPRYKRPTIEKLDASNYRNVAREIIADYEKRGMIFESVLWGQIIGHYESELAAKQGG